MGGGGALGPSRTLHPDNSIIDWISCGCNTILGVGAAHEIRNNPCVCSQVVCWRSGLVRLAGWLINAVSTQVTTSPVCHVVWAAVVIGGERANLQSAKIYLQQKMQEIMLNIAIQTNESTFTCTSAHACGGGGQACCASGTLREWKIKHVCIVSQQAPWTIYRRLRIGRDIS